MVSQWNAQASQHLYSRREKNKLQNLFQLQFWTTGLHSNWTADILQFPITPLHQTYYPAGPSRLADSKKKTRPKRDLNETQTRPKRDPNDPTNKKRTTKYYSSTNLYYKVLLQY